MILKLNLPLDSVAESDDETKTLIDTVIRLYLHFAENTNLHGCLRTAIRTPFRRTIWALMFFAVVGWSLYQLWDILQDYYTYPVTSVIRIKNDRFLLFPAITICNVNRLKKSYIPESVRKELDESAMQDDLSDSTIKSSINGIIRRMSREDRKKALHTLPEMLIDCSFNARQCSERNFSLFEGTTFGNCYTFNNDQDNPLFVTKAGPQYGLALELNVEQDEYLSFTTTAGFKVLIHGPGEPPFPEDGGILVGPGVETSIGIGLTKVDRLPPPYGECVEDKGSPVDSLYAEWNFKYSENGCRKSCYQMSLFKHCNCCDADLPCNKDTIIRVTKSPPQAALRFCSSRHDDLECISEIEQMYLNDFLTCPREHCPTACDQNIYDTYISTGAWPSDSYFDLFLKKINSSDLQNLTASDSDTKKRILNNFLRLEVFYNNLEFIEYVTSPAYSWNKVIGDIGGQMGLWMGFSILAGMEVAELFIDSFVTVVVYLYKKLLDREIIMHISK